MLYSLLGQVLDIAKDFKLAYESNLCINSTGPVMSEPSECNYAISKHATAEQLGIEAQTVL